MTITETLESLRNQDLSRDGEKYMRLVAKLASGKLTPTETSELHKASQIVNRTPQEVQADADAIKRFNELASLASEYDKREVVVKAARQVANDHIATWDATMKKLEADRIAAQTAVNKAASESQQSFDAGTERDRIKSLSPHLFTPYLPAKSVPTKTQGESSEFFANFESGVAFA